MARKREFDEKKVIEIGTQLFWEKGYHAVSTKDLVEAFGISRSSMYAAYHDKRNLFIQCLKHYRDTSAQEFHRILKSKQTFKKKMSLLLNALLKETIFDNQHKGCFIVNTAIELAPHDEEILQLIQQNRKDVITAYTKAIREGIEQGELSEDLHPDSLANYFYNLVNGLRVDAKVQQDSKTYKKVIKIALSTLE